MNKSCGNNLSKKNCNSCATNENFDPNNVCAMNDYKLDENRKFLDFTDNPLEIEARNLNSGNLYQRDFDTYIAPYIKQNINSTVMPVPIPFETGIDQQILVNYPRSEEMRYSAEEMNINNPSNFMSNLPGTISSIICCVLIIFIIYYLFYRR